MRQPALLAAALLLVTTALPAIAQTRLNDDASPRSQVQASKVTSEVGLPLEESPDAQFADARFGRIEFKLDTAAYIGREARVYFVVPHHIPSLLRPSGLTVSWRGSGDFRSGSARPGERQLVWTGRINEATLSTSLDVTMRVDLTAVADSEQDGLGFEPYFEIE